MNPSNSGSAQNRRSYAVELEVAVAAAKVAGELLRAEFHRPGGPRGTANHAEVDEIAEGAIRRILTAAFPEYGYRGEELKPDRPSTDGEGHLWLVDPNDGTNAFMKGSRGAAASVALLRDGEPVLGVVYAYCAPDDRGDLIAWAESAGPIRRNGEPVHRQWPTTPSSECMVLLSRGADRTSAANARATYPMRFRAVPSIAYRLALVAAGEGDAAVSLHGPGDWDYAAGQALLRAAGAELYDSDGNVIEYSRRGESRCGGRCFGGPEGLVRTLVGRDWDTVFKKSDASPARVSLARPVPGQTVPEADVLSRAQGCLLGQFAGDALGSLVEFETADAIGKAYPNGVRYLADGGSWNTVAGQPTDDSEMALALARSIVEAGAYVRESAARAYVEWFRSDPFDMGNTTKIALALGSRALAAGEPVAETAERGANHESQANGALMRVSPLGILGALCDGEKVEAWARADARITHPHPVCQEASALFATAIAYAITTGEDSPAIYGETLRRAEGMKVQPELMRALREAERRGIESYSRRSGWVLIAFQNAFFQLLNAPSLEEGVVDSVMRGGDTDTNAAIAGALLGARWGREAIPRQWMDRVLSCRPVAGLEGVRHPRPEACWPVDALCLAERLLIAGRANAPA